MDNNAFTIHKRSLLAIDSGVNAYDEDVNSDYRTNYYSRTIAHNSITLYDPKETFRGGAFAAEQSGGANDGGQVRLRGPDRIGEIRQNDRWEVGKIVAYQHGPLFTYAVGDATKSYSTAKLRLFRRHFLFLPPDLFVVFDQVEATDPSFRKAWLLHCVDEPSVNGDIVTVTNGPFGSAQGRPGRLTCRTVLPEHPEITKVGGPGKECWVDGRNWPAVEREWSRDAGFWRVEVSPAQPAAEDLFLHVLETDGDEIASPEVVSLTRESGRIGVLIRAQGREYQVTFSTSAPSAHLRIAEHGGTVLEEDLH
jgi:heparin/heparan-sulfate lyase